MESKKSHLFKTLGNTPFTFKELYNAFVRIEAIRDSRPISPSDLTALTPGHSFTGGVFNAIPEEDVTATP